MTRAYADLTKTLDETTAEVIEGLERTYLVAALEMNQGRIQATAKTAGISRRTLLRKMRKYRLNKRHFRAAPGDPLTTVGATG